MSTLMNKYLHEVALSALHLNCRIPKNYSTSCFQGAGDVQSHEALKDAEDLLAVAKAMAEKREMTLHELLQLSPKREFIDLQQ